MSFLLHPYISFPVVFALAGNEIADNEIKKYWKK
jgi:hypothetical protein